MEVWVPVFTYHQASEPFFPTSWPQLHSWPLQFPLPADNHFSVHTTNIWTLFCSAGAPGGGSTTLQIVALRQKHDIALQQQKANKPAGLVTNDRQRTQKKYCIATPAGSGAAVPPCGNETCAPAASWWRLPTRRRVDILSCFHSALAGKKMYLSQVLWKLSCLDPFAYRNSLD